MLTLFDSYCLCLFISSIGSVWMSMLMRELRATFFFKARHRWPGWWGGVVGRHSTWVMMMMIVSTTASTATRSTTATVASSIGFQFHIGIIEWFEIVLLLPFHTSRRRKNSASRCVLSKTPSQCSASSSSLTDFETKSKSKQKQREREKSAAKSKGRYFDLPFCQVKIISNFNASPTCQIPWKRYQLRAREGEMHRWFTSCSEIPFLTPTFDDGCMSVEYVCVRSWIL